MQLLYHRGKRDLDNLLAVIIVLALVGIWFFIKKRPDKRNRNICIVVAIVSFVLFGIFTDSKEKKEAKNPTSTSQSESTPTSSMTEVKIETAESFETDSEGNVTITGKTEPNAKVSVGISLGNDAVEADSEGNFSIEYKLTKDKEKKIQIIATKDDTSSSKETIIKPSQAYSEQMQAQASAAAVSDIMQLQEEPTSNQETILDSLRDQQFKQQYPYKGSKIKTMMGQIQPWTVNKGRWYYKAECVIVNAFGAEQDANIEVHITPTGESSGNVELIVY